MKISHFALRLAILALVCATPVRSFADTYQLVDLGGDNATSFLGLSSTGLAFFETNFPDTLCANDTCYFTYYNGVEIGTSSTPPSFTVDDGTICSPTLGAGWLASRAVCNNGRVAFTGTYGGNPPTGVYFTTNPPQPIILTQIGGGGIWMNSIGDVIFDDAFHDNWYEAVDLSTSPVPEPASILLLATGLLALAVILRRRTSVFVKGTDLSVP